jgi:cytochrome c oxidase subunit 1
MTAAPSEALLARSRADGDLLVLTHVYTGTAALVVGALFGLLQGFSRANFIVMPPAFDYYRMLTAHGVLMALVFTTFFITGLGTFATYRTIPRVRSVALGWWGYLTMLVGTVMAAITILSGNATVLYTFYAPLKASPWFYIGAALLIVGTWIVALDIVLNMVWFKRSHPGTELPLPAHGAVFTFVMWVIATIGVVIEVLFLLIPWSLGLTKGIDVGLTRLLFWYFGHPLVYFWIMGAYLIWYNVIPTTYGGKVFSNALTRLAFLMLLLLSTPVGLHHQFLDPGVSAGWKWLHTVLTFGVAIPSFMTAFAIFASFELAARRAGRTGLLAILRGLPWGDPTFSGAALAMLLFIPGGFGGIVNASYAMNVMVHNTMWIVGHFHITVGGPVALTFIAFAYRLVPVLTGRRLFAPKLALAQTYLWFVGMTLMSLAMHWAGLLGSPRRTADVSYFGSAGALTWHGQMVAAAIGGTLLFISILMFATVAVGTYFADVHEPARTEFSFAPVEDEAMPVPPALDLIGRWGLVAIGLAVVAYAGPVYDQLSVPHYLAPGMRTW